MKDYRRDEVKGRHRVTASVKALNTWSRKVEVPKLGTLVKDEQSEAENKVHLRGKEEV
jgi:hypothetical protein